MSVMALLWYPNHECTPLLVKMFVKETMLNLKIWKVLFKHKLKQFKMIVHRIVNSKHWMDDDSSKGERKRVTFVIGIWIAL
jgi:hypothetical protein